MSDNLPNYTWFEIRLTGIKAVHPDELSTLELSFYDDNNADTEYGAHPVVLRYKVEAVPANPLTITSFTVNDSGKELKFKWVISGDNYNYTITDGDNSKIIYSSPLIPQQLLRILMCHQVTTPIY